MSDSFGEAIGNFNLIASKTESLDSNFNHLNNDPAKLNRIIKGEMPPSSLILPHLSESRMQGMSNLPGCDSFNMSHENQMNILHGQQRQGNGQPNQRAMPLLKNDNFALSYSFQGRDKSPMRDRNMVKKENFSRNEYDRIQEVYDYSPGMPPQSKGDFASTLPFTSPKNTASIFRQRNDTGPTRTNHPYGGDRRDKSKMQGMNPPNKSTPNEGVFDERKQRSIRGDPAESYRRERSNASFEHRSPNQKPGRAMTEGRVNESSNHYPRNHSSSKDPSSPGYLNTSFDVCLSDGLGSLPLEGTFNSFGNEDVPNGSDANGLNSSHHRSDSMVDPRQDNKRRRQYGGITTKGENQDPSSDLPYNSNANNTNVENCHGTGTNFYVGLRSHKGALSDLNFLLPGLKGPSNNHVDRSPLDLVIGKRRVASSVCAFGGITKQKPKALRNGDVSSIFRTKRDDEDNSSNSRKSRNRVKYEQKLPLRYFENENRLSWEVEESLPLDMLTDDEDTVTSTSNSKVSSSKVTNAKAKNDAKVSEDGEQKKSSKETSTSKKSNLDGKIERCSPAMSSSGNSGDTPKMKYRCKLCGQPKQNHICPYQQSLQRSIGTMSYATLNAYDADEPGVVAPPLSEMNNFVAVDEDQLICARTPPRPRSVASSRSPNSRSSNSPHCPNTVTPDHGNKIINQNLSMSPNSRTSSLSSPHSGIGESREKEEENYDKVAKRRTGVYSTLESPRSRDMSNDPLFRKTMEMKPDQFRVVTPSKELSSDRNSTSFKYPTLPLTYGQRKKMSDSLFTLSKEVKGLTDECAEVLAEARETDSWDLAVAELITQIIIVIHCSKDDKRLEGLQHYLMTLGISC